MTSTHQRFLARLIVAAPWLILVAVLATLVPALLGGDLVSPMWATTLLASAAAALLLSRLVYGISVAYPLVLAAGVTNLVFNDATRDVGIDRPLTWPEIVADLAVAVGLVCVLGYSTTRRLGTPPRRYLVEVVVVFIGASIATWVVITEPLLDAGNDPARAMLASVFIPINVLIGAFLVDLWNVGLRANRAMQLATVSAVAYVTASVVERLQLVGTVDNPMLATTIYTVSAAFMLASISHGDFAAHLDTVDEPATGADTQSRLVMMGVSVLVAVTLTATNAPTGTADVAVRMVVTIVLIALVVVRLAIALHEHESARRSLQLRFYRDDLTSLPTRTRFAQLVNDVLESNWRTERHPTVIHLNVDRFKNINDTFGHHGANEVLVELASRIDAAARSFGGQAARIGGDDFAVIDAATRTTDDAVRHAEIVRAALAAPINAGETTIFVTASIGVAMAPAKRSLAAEELMRRADIANHRAKGDGANRVAVFDESMQATVTERMDVEHALHGAIGRQEMRLYHQPIVDITTGQVNGFEALIRWQRSDGTILPPATFIPIAEDTGIICEIGEWALRDALAVLRTWIDTGVVDPTTTISVNVSPRQIAHPGFTDVVRDALRTSGVSPHLLWLEMTETMMLEEPELAAHTLREVRAMGVQLALDDFGTGFSSLSLLQNFPIQRIKIDRAFVQGIADNNNDRSLVRTIVAMADSMGLDLVAEGVETVHQLQSLRELGCSKAQGYLISHPVPAPAMGSTMTALAELANLSLFQPTTIRTTISASKTGTTRGEAPVPTTAGAGTYGYASPRGPIGQPTV